MDPLRPCLSGATLPGQLRKDVLRIALRMMEYSDVASTQDTTIWASNWDADAHRSTAATVIQDWPARLLPTSRLASAADVPRTTLGGRPI